ncbi:hypothetical protein [Streptomyces shaanxiensis]|uniref:beta-xylosidase family glycoside hydrolase n=1 Tax=Streptomyces shaanxiensis TaxID=653357 RepID=UPI003CD05E43
MDGAGGLASPRTAPPRDDFGAAILAPYRISPHRRPEGSWSLSERPGRLTLPATGDSLDRPGHAFVGRRRHHPDCRFEARSGTRNGPRRTARSPGRGPSLRPRGRRARHDRPRDRQPFRSRTTR